MSVTMQTIRKNILSIFTTNKTSPAENISNNGNGNGSGKINPEYNEDTNENNNSNNNKKLRKKSSRFGRKKTTQVEVRHSVYDEGMDNKIVLSATMNLQEAFNDNLGHTSPHSERSNNRASKNNDKNKKRNDIGASKKNKSDNYNNDDKDYNTAADGGGGLNYVSISTHLKELSDDGSLNNGDDKVVEKDKGNEVDGYVHISNNDKSSLDTNDSDLKETDKVYTPATSSPIIDKTNSSQSLELENVVQSYQLHERDDTNITLQESFVLTTPTTANADSNNIIVRDDIENVAQFTSCDDSSTLTTSTTTENVDCKNRIVNATTTDSAVTRPNIMVVPPSSERPDIVIIPPSIKGPMSSSSASLDNSVELLSILLKDFNNFPIRADDPVNCNSDTFKDNILSEKVPVEMDSIGKRTSLELIDELLFDLDQLTLHRK
eukprot:Awhi_evm1s637